MSLIGYARVSTAEGRQWQASTCLPPSSSTGTPPGWAKRSLGEDMPACPWSPSSCHTSRPSVGPTSCSPANTDGKNAELSLTCHFALFRNRPLIALKSADARTRVAVTRWKKSMKRRASLTDGFIELRIALESLFLPQTPDQQLKFRLATNGAWLVGDNGADRRKVWHILRDAYDAASKAVHHGKVKQNGENKELLANAQMVCRKGILRVLRDRPVTDWDGLILDAPTQSPP